MEASGGGRDGDAGGAVTSWGRGGGCRRGCDAMGQGGCRRGWDAMGERPGWRQGWDVMVTAHRGTVLLSAFPACMIFI